MIWALMARGALSLTIFGALTAGLVAAVYVGTQDTIEENQARRAIQALVEVLPAHDNDLLQAQRTLTDGRVLTEARLGNEIVGYALTTQAPDGYTGPIDLVVAVDSRNVITGVRVTEHRETPGLGDKIDLRKSDWILSFNGTSLTNPEQARWAPKPDGGAFDAFTGATITPRAVISEVRRSLETLERYTRDG